MLGLTPEPARSTRVGSQPNEIDGAADGLGVGVVISNARTQDVSVAKTACLWQPSSEGRPARRRCGPTEFRYRNPQVGLPCIHQHDRSDIAQSLVDGAHAAVDAVEPS
jgi:hypothetical protein